MQTISSRTKSVYINSIITLIAQIIQVVLGFVLRKIFIDTLGITYLGYNSVFVNILQMLNLADLGMGVAITSYLYKPLAEKNIEEVSALMTLYKKIYSFIGFLVALLGFITSFFLPILIPDAKCSNVYLMILFYLNLLGTVSTYFLAYKRTLLIADQKAYIASLTDFIMYVIISVLQAIFLYVQPDYIVYLVLNITKSILSNFILSLKADKIYGKIYNNKNKKVINQYKKEIYKYVKDVFISRIGATVFYGTDNVVISIFKGSIEAGFLSNYTMITTQLSTILGQIFSSLQGTFGNYINSNKNIMEQRQMTNNYFFINFIIGNICMLCFTLLAQPFIELFFGENMLLSFSTALWLGINLLLSMMLQLPSQVFVIYKLFKYDRPIILFSAIMNIIISTVLVNLIGLDGVLIGTFITSLIYMFSRFYIISKQIFLIDYLYYVKKIMFYFLISFISFSVVYFSTYSIDVVNLNDLIIKCLIVGSLSSFISATLLSFTKEYKYFIDKFIPKFLNKFFDLKYLLSINIVLFIICMIVSIIK